MNKPTLTRHNILLVKGDLDKIRKVYDRQASEIVRKLVRDFVRKQIDPILEQAEE